MQIPCWSSPNVCAIFAPLKNLQRSRNNSDTDQYQSIQMDIMRYSNRSEGDEQDRYTSIVIYDCEGVDETVVYEPLRGATAADASNNVEPTASWNSDAPDGFDDGGNTANNTDELHSRARPGDKQQYRKAAAEEDNCAGSSEDGYNDRESTVDRCNCTGGHSYMGATADGYTEESEDEHTHREEEYTYTGHISRGNNSMTTSTNEQIYMRTVAPLHNDRGEVVDRYNYRGTSAGGHNTGNTMKPHHYWGATVDCYSHMPERNVHNHMGATADRHNNLTNIMERNNDVGACVDGHRYMGGTADGRNYMANTTQSHIRRTAKKPDYWRARTNGNDITQRPL